VSPATANYEYVIIGAGPAGLQMGYFLGRAGRRYVILEAAPAAGAFFARFPRHGMLISINKPHNFYPEPEYNLRHDWNSLISHDESLLFKHYSSELYPAAQDMCRYLGDFAAKLGLEVRWGAAVDEVAREGEGFRVTVAGGEAFTCDRLLVATGATGPNIPAIPGIELCLGYEDHPIDAAFYRNKRVAIVGAGNSAFEVANHLAGSAAIIHMFMGRPARHAWQTHFVGDLRAVNNTIIDMYQLKSMHATIGVRLVSVTRNADGTLEAEIEEGVPHWEQPGTLRATFTYDAIIRCTGWRYVRQDLFGEGCVPAMDARDKYPVLSSSWESSVPGMYFIGAAMAARDRTAASGFIHGFRYNIRTLHRLLEQRFHGGSLVDETFPLRERADLDAIASSLISRVSTTSALYQMYGFLCDAMFFSEDDVAYLRELPVDYVHEMDAFRGGDAITVTLEYGFHHYPSTSVAVDFINPSDPDRPLCTAFIHPVFRYYRGGQLVDEMHFGEHFYVRYDLVEHVMGHPVDSRARNEARVKNLINKWRRLVDETFTVQPTPEEALDKAFRVWSPAEIAEDRARREAAAARDALAPCKAAV